MIHIKLWPWFDNELYFVVMTQFSCFVKYSDFRLGWAHVKRISEDLGSWQQHFLILQANLNFDLIMWNSPVASWHNSEFHFSQFQISLAMVWFLKYFVIFCLIIVSQERSMKGGGWNKINLDQEMDFVKPNSEQISAEKTMKVESWNENKLVRRVKVLSFHTLDNLGRGNLLWSRINQKLYI